MCPLRKRHNPKTAAACPHARKNKKRRAKARLELISAVTAPFCPPKYLCPLFCLTVLERARDFVKNAVFNEPRARLVKSESRAGVQRLLPEVQHP